MKTTFRNLALLGVLTSTLTLMSCKDQDFDWDAAKRTNPEYNYAQNFEKIFGTISPDQNWDLSYWGRHNQAMTRAIAEGEDDGDNTTTMTPIYVTALPSDVHREWKEMYSDHYAVKFMTSNSGNNDWGNLGGKFVLQAPYCGFSVSVMYYHINSGQTGVNFENIELHMCVQKDDNSYYDYTIWTDKTLTSNPDVYYSSNDGKTWSPMPKQTSGGGLKTSAIKSNSFVFGSLNDASNVVPPGTTIWFYTLYVGGRNNGEANLSQGNIGNTTSSKGTMVAFNIAGTSDHPNPIYEERDENGNITKQGLLIGSELDRHASGGSNYNFNDLVFLIEGIPLVPQREEITDEGTVTERTEHTKRYMVEDMGYSDPESQAVSNGYTDIDFNDIVVDFSSVRTVEKTWISSTTSPVPSYTVISDNTEVEAKVYALGGIWDFILKVDGQPVFQKGGATQVAKDADGNYTNAGPSKVDFNNDYPTFLGPSPALVASEIYNTGSTFGVQDGQYPTSTEGFRDSYICQLTSEAINDWNPNTNNISFEIIDNGVVGTDYGQGIKDLLNSNKDSQNVYHLSFPAMGACPKIVAFDPTKQWKLEKNPVSTDWFKSNN